MFYLDDSPNSPPGFKLISTSDVWISWIEAVLPREADATVLRRLQSNLKHIIVGLEMKAALIVPHGERQVGKPVLFEPYCQVMTFEFCVGVFSICEGLGSILYLTSVGDEGKTGQRVNPGNWKASLVSLGLKVIGTNRNKDNFDFIKNLGAEPLKKPPTRQS